MARARVIAKARVWVWVTARARARAWARARAGARGGERDHVAAGAELLEGPLVRAEGEQRHGARRSHAV